jgi:hypothetical protein
MPAADDNVAHSGWLCGSVRTSRTTIGSIGLELKCSCIDDAID